MFTKALAIFLAISLLVCGIGCSLFSSSSGRKPLEELSCTMVEAFSGDARYAAICATSFELIELAAQVEAFRVAPPDGGAMKAGKCKMIPSTKTCATDAELSPAIATALTKRSDGGK